MLHMYWTQDEHCLVQYTPQGTIIYESESRRSTLGLTFATSSLAEKIIHCDVRQNMSHDSDHLPIYIDIDLVAQNVPEPKRRARDRVDVDALLRAWIRTYQWLGNTAEVH